VTESQKAADWIRWVNAAEPSYRFHALLAVLENDGPQMTARVLKELQITSALELLQKCSCR
jgi:hypothetical protein